MKKTQDTIFHRLSLVLGQMEMGHFFSNLHSLVSFPHTPLNYSNLVPTSHFQNYGQEDQWPKPITTVLPNPIDNLNEHLRSPDKRTNSTSSRNTSFGCHDTCHFGRSFFSYLTCCFLRPFLNLLPLPDLEVFECLSPFHFSTLFPLSDLTQHHTFEYHLRTDHSQFFFFF